MLLFIYFNPIIGPDLLYSSPENIKDHISEEDMDQIKRLMDAATPGFFTHTFSGELHTANYFFMIPSAWARGKQEMVMISKIIEEESPNLSAYEKEFKKFIAILKNDRPGVYKALYTHNPPLNYEEEIQEEFEYLKSEIQQLGKFFAITEVQTHGTLIAFDDIRKNRALHLPNRILRDLDNFLENKDKYFIVFQKRKDNFKIDVIPYNGEKVVKIAVIFNGQLTPETLKDIGIAFQRMEFPIVYTSGICQSGGKCIYEVYLNPLDQTDFEWARETLLKIKNVEEIKIIEIDIHNRD